VPFSYKLIAGILFLATAICAGQSGPAEDELLIEAEHAAGGKRAKLYLQLSERNLKLAKTEFGNGNNDQGLAALEKFSGYVREAFQTKS
jgi:hypothetical protein